MSSLSNQTTLYWVLLLTFEGSHLANDVSYMRQVMEGNFGWGVLERILPTSSSKDAQDALDRACQELRGKVEDRPNKAIIYYGGHATLQDKNSKPEWKWLSAPKDGYPVCIDHMLKVDPTNMLIDILKRKIDACFIFQSPFDKSMFPTPDHDSLGPMRGNVQVLAMTEAASGTKLMGGICIENTCENDLCVVCPNPPSTGRSPTRALMGFLETQLAARNGVNLETLITKLTESTGDIDMSKPGSNCLLTLSESGADGQSDSGSSAVASSAATSAVQRYVLDKPPVHVAVNAVARNFVLKKAHFAWRGQSPLITDP